MTLPLSALFARRVLESLMGSSECSMKDEAEIPTKIVAISPETRAASPLTLSNPVAGSFDAALLSPFFTAIGTGPF